MAIFFTNGFNLIPNGNIVPSITPSISVTPFLTVTPSITPSVTPSITPTISVSATPSISVTPSVSISNTPSISVTPSISISTTPSISVTPSISISNTPSPSVTPSISISNTPSVSISKTPSISVTPSITTSITPSITPTITVSRTISVTPSITPSITPSSGSVAASGAMSFNGTVSSYARTAPNNTNFQFGTGDFTIEWWQNLSTAASSFPRVFEVGTAALAVSQEGSSASRTFYLWTAGANAIGTITSSLNNTWNHFAITRAGTSLRVFRNGTQFGTTITNSTNFNSTSAITVGNRTSGLSTEAFSGSITNFHWVKGVAKYTASFTPAGPLTPISGSSTLLLLAQTSSSLLTDSSGFNNIITGSSVAFTSSTPF